MLFLLLLSDGAGFGGGNGNGGNGGNGDNDDDKPKVSPIIRLLRVKSNGCQQTLVILNCPLDIIVAGRSSCDLYPNFLRNLRHFRCRPKGLHGIF